MWSTPWLTFVNIILLVISLVVLMIGAIIQTSLNSHYSLFSGSINAPAALMITFGALLFFTALLAILSVYCQNYILLCAYICVLAVLIVIQVSLGATYIIAKSYLLEFIIDSLRSAETKYTSDHFASATWNSLQRDLKCCGVDHYKEWFHYLGNSSVPDSCCVIYTDDCGRSAIADGNSFQTGCGSAIAQWSQKHAISIAILLSCILILQTSSLLLSRHLRRVLYRPDSIESFETSVPHY